MRQAYAGLNSIYERLNAVERLPNRIQNFHLRKIEKMYNNGCSYVIFTLKYMLKCDPSNDKQFDFLMLRAELHPAAAVRSLHFLVCKKKPDDGLRKGKLLCKSSIAARTGAYILTVKQILL
jgi:hypothetical protein